MCFLWGHFFYTAGTSQTREDDKTIDIHINYGELSPLEQEYMKDKVKFAQAHPVEAERIHLKFKVRALDTRLTRTESACRNHPQPGESSPEAQGSSLG